MARRSPVKLVCTRPWRDVGDDMKVCKWKCPEGGGTVQFRSRDRPDWFAVLHPSTRHHGKAWQVSHFDKDGAVGDVVRSSCEVALYDGGIDRNWKLEQVGAFGGAGRGGRMRYARPPARRPAGRRRLRRG